MYVYTDPLSVGFHPTHNGTTVPVVHSRRSEGCRSYKYYLLLGNNVHMQQFELKCWGCLIRDRCGNVLHALVHRYPDAATYGAHTHSSGLATLLTGTVQQYKPAHQHTNRLGSCATHMFSGNSKTKYIRNASFLRHRLPTLVHAAQKRQLSATPLPKPLLLPYVIPRPHSLSLLSRVNLPHASETRSV